MLASLFVFYIHMTVSEDRFFTEGQFRFPHRLGVFPHPKRIPEPRRYVLFPKAAWKALIVRFRRPW